MSPNFAPDECFHTFEIQHEEHFHHQIPQEWLLCQSCRASWSHRETSGSVALIIEMMMAMTMVMVMVMMMAMLMVMDMILGSWFVRKEHSIIKFLLRQGNLTRH